MKGLFRKDVYVFLKKLKLFLLLIPVFLCGPYAPDSILVLVYPILLFSMLPMSLFSMDEKSGFENFVWATPVSRAAAVLEKYLFTLSYGLLVLVLVGLGYLIAGHSVKVILGSLGRLLGVALLGPGFMLPVLFWRGSEKGQLVYMAGLGFLCLFGILWVDPDSSFLFLHPGPFALISLVIFSVSCLISMLLYQSREL